MVAVVFALFWGIVCCLMFLPFELSFSVSVRNHWDFKVTSKCTLYLENPSISRNFQSRATSQSTSRMTSIFKADPWGCYMGVESPKIGVLKSPQIIPCLGFSLIFTIHFGVFPPMFGSTPILHPILKIIFFRLLLLKTHGTFSKNREEIQDNHALKRYKKHCLHLFRCFILPSFNDLFDNALLPFMTTWFPACFFRCPKHQQSIHLIHDKMPQQNDLHLLHTLTKWCFECCGACSTIIELYIYIYTCTYILYIYVK